MFRLGGVHLQLWLWHGTPPTIVPGIMRPDAAKLPAKAAAACALTTAATTISAASPTNSAALTTTAWYLLR